MGIHTNFWGPGAWAFLHSITFNYPEYPSSTDQHIMQQFFHSLKNVLPCEQCQKHFTRAIEQTMPIEPHLGSRDDLTRWLVQFHNTVNKRLGKPIMPYETVRAKYQSMQGKCQIHQLNSSCSSKHDKSPPSCSSRTSSLRGTISFVHILIIILLVVIIGLIVWYRNCLKKSLSPI